MRGTVLYDARDIRFEDRPEPQIQKPTDAIIRMSATCVCGSDLWPFPGHPERSKQPMAMGHEYCGIVERSKARSRPSKKVSLSSRSFCISDKHMSQLSGRLPVRLPES